MKLYDVEQTAQDGFADACEQEQQPKQNNFKKKDFSGFKV
jgi:hypothetical protein